MNTEQTDTSGKPTYEDRNEKRSGGFTQQDEESGIPWKGNQFPFWTSKQIA
jgi:hypothetical protein